MKCIRCGHDSKYKDRAGRRCPQCQGLFAFEPKEGDRCTDRMFESAIRAVSGDGRIRFGVEHVHYELAGALQRRRMTPRRAAVVAGIVVVVALIAFRNLWVALLFGAAALALGLVASRHPLVSPSASEFSKLWSRWCSAHGKPPGVIERQFSRGAAPPQPATLEADVADYSFDRAVICDRARTVDLLVANNFHFENNCAVLSIDGYPEGPFETIRRMLKRNPRLLVVAVHDATPAGCRLAHQVAYAPEWFAGKLRVVDLGLRPRHAGPYRGRWLAAAAAAAGAGASGSSASSRAAAEASISASEAAWLGRHSLELAALRPEQVLKRIHHGLLAHANDDVSGGGTSQCASFDGGSSSSASEDSSDSFG